MVKQDGSGMNSAGQQLMVTRDRLRSNDPNNELEDPWTQFISNMCQANPVNGECGGIEGRTQWAEVAKAATGAFGERMQGSQVITAKTCKVVDYGKESMSRTEDGYCQEHERAAVHVQDFSADGCTNKAQ